MKKKDKRLVWVLAFDYAIVSITDGIRVKLYPEEDRAMAHMSERIIRVKYHKDGVLREAESANTVYKLKPRPRGRPRRSE